MVYVLLLFVALLYIKWICLFVVYPLNVLYIWGQNHKALALLGLPYRVVASFTRSGWEKFQAVNIGRLPSYHLRKWAYKGLGMQAEKMVMLRYQTEIWSAHHLRIGKGTIGGYNLLLDARNGIEIGENVNFSANVSVYTEQHDHRAPDFSCDSTLQKKVTIGNRVWIGPNVIILPGVLIGEGAVLAAGCVVTKDVEPFAVVGGIPAKKVNERPRNLRYEFNGKGSRIY